MRKKNIAIFFVVTLSFMAIFILKGSSVLELAVPKTHSNPFVETVAIPLEHLPKEVATPIAAHGRLCWRLTSSVLHRTRKEAQAAMLAWIEKLNSQKIRVIKTRIVDEEFFEGFSSKKEHFIFEIDYVGEYYVDKFISPEVFLNESLAREQLSKVKALLKHKIWVLSAFVTSVSSKPVAYGYAVYYGVKHEPGSDEYGIKYYLNPKLKNATANMERYAAKLKREGMALLSSAITENGITVVYLGNRDIVD